jgi:hypothetical protein
MRLVLALSPNWAATREPSPMQTSRYKISFNPPPVKQCL